MNQTIQQTFEIPYYIPPNLFDSFIEDLLDEDGIVFVEYNPIKDLKLKETKEENDNGELIIEVKFLTSVIYHEVTVEFDPTIIQPSRVNDLVRLKTVRRDM